MAKVGTLNVEIKLDTRQFMEQMRRATATMNQFARAFAKIGKILGDNRHRIFPGVDAVDFRFPPRPPSAWKPYRPYDHRGIV